METLILASTSPRRQQLLTSLGIAFEVVPSGYEEVFDHRPPLEQVQFLAEMKVRSVLSEHPELKYSPILGADTCIDLDSHILGKPADREAARSCLERMSGRRHNVITGLSLWDGRNEEFLHRAEVTEISLAELSREEIDWYLNTNEWQGAAGGYRIQGKGSLFVERIDGCFYNVMGLPIRLFYGMLQTQGYHLL